MSSSVSHYPANTWRHRPCWPCCALELAPVHLVTLHSSEWNRILNPSSLPLSAGHVPMLADPAYADLVHQIGIASLGADEKQIWHLTKVYW